jgi:ferrous iron transport protein A
MNILHLTPGQRATVTEVTAQGAIRRRLLDMGILPGTTFTVARVAPFGGPVWIKLSDSQFALRSREAQAILVAKLEVESEALESIQAERSATDRTSLSPL